MGKGSAVQSGMKRATKSEGMGQGGSGMGAWELGQLCEGPVRGVSPVDLGIGWSFSPGSSSPLSCDPGQITSFLCALDSSV